MTAPTKKQNKRWIECNREAHLAHMAVATAIKRGKLHKQPCGGCGNPKAHAHHLDYTKRLDITWLCATCHRAWHTIQKGQVVGGKTYHRPYIYQYRYRGRSTVPLSEQPKKKRIEAEAKVLRTEGMTYKAIGERLDVSIATAYKAVNNTPYH